MTDKSFQLELVGVRRTRIEYQAITLRVFVGALKAGPTTRITLGGEAEGEAFSLI